MSYIYTHSFARVNGLRIHTPFK